MQSGDWQDICTSWLFRLSSARRRMSPAQVSSAMAGADRALTGEDQPDTGEVELLLAKRNGSGAGGSGAV